MRKTEQDALDEAAKNKLINLEETESSDSEELLMSIGDLNLLKVPEMNLQNDKASLIPEDEEA